MVKPQLFLYLKSQKWCILAYAFCSLEVHPGPVLGGQEHEDLAYLSPLLCGPQDISAVLGTLKAHAAQARSVHLKC